MCKRLTCDDSDIAGCKHRKQMLDGALIEQIDVELERGDSKFWQARQAQRNIKVAGNAVMANRARVLEFAQSLKDIRPFCDRGWRIMQEEQIDVIGLQSPQTALHALLNVLRVETL